MEESTPVDNQLTQRASQPPTQEAAACQNTSCRPILRLEGVWVWFGRRVVLRDIWLDIAPRESVAIIGESGCGKTVLLKTMIGLIRPNRGQVLFDGINLGEVGEAELARLRTRLGFVFQQAALFDSMTVGENVAFPLRQHTSKSEEEIRQIALARLAEVGLPPRVAEQYPAQLSGGMRKRVGIARALALGPEVMLYDEPTTGLDPIMSDVINELIMATRRHHPVTTVVVTHDMRTAKKVADRIVMLYPVDRLRADERQIIYDGPAVAIDQATDPRVIQFIRGEAGERLLEVQQNVNNP
ncbi:MAG: ABC transporter ATP-binding protein [Thermoguttaceae bacterium]|nr:ABC transporter ATP-binding protein [Thermoguttaceae bacterium]MDW8078180.1 ABC transporter ATP-binding protein [Thermoguttaceae bacterium]